MPLLLQELARQADPWAVDLLLSALAGAAASPRRATCTTPFPTAAFAAGEERDYVALLESVQALPPAAHLPACLDGLSRQQEELLLWLLAHPKRPVLTMRRCTLRRMQEQLPHQTGWLADIGRNPGLRPSAVLQLGEVPAALGDGSGARLLAFHGTPWDNLHSILHHGLINASGTRLERTGSVFGKGIYFSAEPHVAFAFALPAQGWRASALGARLRCLLCCSIERDAALGSHNNDLVPDKYVLVERMDAVAVHFVLLYADEAPTAAAAPRADHAPAPGAHAPAQQQRDPAAAQGRSALLYLIAGYAAWLLYMCLRENWPLLRRMLRRKLGIRL